MLKRIVLVVLVAGALLCSKSAFGACWVPSTEVTSLNEFVDFFGNNINEGTLQNPNRAVADLMPVGLKDSTLSDASFAGPMVPSAMADTSVTSLQSVVTLNTSSVSTLAGANGTAGTPPTNSASSAIGTNVVPEPVSSLLVVFGALACSLIRRKNQAAV